MLLDFGFSPCPNDTFMFWAWVHERHCGDFPVRPQMADIEELNRRALSDDPLMLTKVSASTYLLPEVQARYRLLSTGAALGRGCGPLLVCRQGRGLTGKRPFQIAVPGLNTSAFRLARAALDASVERWVEMRYDQIMTAVAEGREIDAGVLIHESRFTYPEHGLELALDLGAWWEERTGLPLPLGVMVARRDLPETVVGEAERLLSQSIAAAWRAFDLPKNEPPADSLWSYLREHATELSDEVIVSHIKLYVNSFSSDLGPEGRGALEQFGRLEALL